MKLSVKPGLLKITILSAGLLGLLLRMVLYATAMDEKGLLVSGHWAGVSVWLLTAAVAVALIFLTQTIQGPADYRDSHPVSFLAGLSCILLAAAIALTALTELENAPSFLITVLSFAAAAALVLTAYCRLSGSKPHFLCHCLLCAFFAIRMVGQYQHWSSDPQIQDYVFYLSAYVALMLTAYQQAAFDADMGNHRHLWLLSLAAVYLCCLSLKDPMDTWLLLASGFWACANMTSLKVRPRRQRPALNLEEE